MNPETKIPFGLKPTELPLANLLLGFYSGKTGAGRQEITLRGDGSVQLFHSRSMEDDQPKTLQGTLPPQVFLTLLDLFEDGHFFSLNDLYAGGHDHPHAHARRILTLSLPGREKTVILEEPELYVAEQLVGATRLAAGIALPDAIGHHFFPNLS